MCPSSVARSSQVSVSQIRYQSAGDVGSLGGIIPRHGADCVEREIGERAEDDEIENDRGTRGGGEAGGTFAADHDEHANQGQH